MQTERDRLERALELLVGGDWRAAHTLVQGELSPLAAWLHGIAHVLEGDLENARYWYEQAQRPFPERGAAAAGDETRLARQALVQAQG